MERKRKEEKELKLYCFDWEKIIKKSAKKISKIFHWSNKLKKFDNLIIS